jgi:hypothetical protein
MTGWTWPSAVPQGHHTGIHELTSNARAPSRRCHQTRLPSSAAGFHSTDWNAMPLLGIVALARCTTTTTGGGLAMDNTTRARSPVMWKRQEGSLMPGQTYTLVSARRNMSAPAAWSVCRTRQQRAARCWPTPPSGAAQSPALPQPATALESPVSRHPALWRLHGPDERRTR